MLLVQYCSKRWAPLTTLSKPLAMYSQTWQHKKHSFKITYPKNNIKCYTGYFLILKTKFQTTLIHYYLIQHIFSCWRVKYFFFRKISHAYVITITFAIYDPDTSWENKRSSVLGKRVHSWQFVHFFTTKL